MARPSKLLPINYWGKWRTLSEIKETIINCCEVTQFGWKMENFFLFSCSIYLLNWEFLELNCMKLIKNQIFSIILRQTYRRVLPLLVPMVDAVEDVGREVEECRESLSDGR